MSTASACWGVRSRRSMSRRTCSSGSGPPSLQILHHQMHGRPPFRSGEPALLLQKERPLEVQPPGPGGCRPLCDLLIQHPALQLGSRHLGGDSAGRRVAIAQASHGGEIIPFLLHRSLLRGRSRRPTFKHRVLPQPHLPAAIGEGRLLPAPCPPTAAAPPPPAYTAAAAGSSPPAPWRSPRPPAPQDSPPH